MPALLGALVAGAASGGAEAENKVLAAQRQADLDKQLMQQRAEIEQHMQVATEQRHIQYAANLRTAMDEQLTPATEAILNSQGKTGLPANPTPTPSTPTPAPGGNLTATGVTPGAPAATDYAQAATGLLAGPDNVPATPVAQKTNYAQATPTEALTARALAMVKTGWVSNPDDVLKAAVTLNDTTQTSQARLEASKAIAEASILASKVRGENAASIHVNDPNKIDHEHEVDLRGRAENLRKQIKDQQTIIGDPLAKPEAKTAADARKMALTKVLDAVNLEQATGQPPESVVQSQPNTVSWNSLPK